MEPSVFPIPPEIQARLDSCTTLPSPPKVALQIIELAKDPNLEIEDVVKVLSIDPALSAKILRLANSALYGHQKKVKDLTKATMIIGFNGVLSMALSFSLITSLRREQGEGLNHMWFWRRALLNGVAGRSLAEACKRKDLEQIFTAAFIQDIGMLAIDQIEPALYKDLNLTQIGHPEVLAHEVERMGVNHAIVGARLLAQWNLPDELVMAVRYSDEPNLVSAGAASTLFSQCVAFAGPIADLCLIEASDETLLNMSEHFQTTLNLGPLAFLEIIKTVKGAIRDIGPTFDLPDEGEMDLDKLLERARQLLALRQIKLDQQLNTLTAKI